MLTPVSENLYNYLSTYGGEMFNNETLSKKAFAYAHSFAKFNYDIGYYFEDMNSINLLNYIGESNYILLPKMIYYIKEEKAKKLNDLKIISIPEDFEFHDPSKDEKEFEGYNEIDLAIYNKKEVCIQSNENFKLIPKDLYLKFKPANKENSDETKKIPRPWALPAGFIIHIVPGECLYSSTNMVNSLGIWKVNGKKSYCFASSNFFSLSKAFL